MAMGRSSSFAPDSRKIVRTESRVTPGRMVPASGGVMATPSMFTMMFMTPDSSRKRRSFPSSHNTL